MPSPGPCWTPLTAGDASVMLLISSTVETGDAHAPTAVLRCAAASCSAALRPAQATKMNTV
jgi:hypothetical protein